MEKVEYIDINVETEEEEKYLLEIPRAIKYGELKLKIKEKIVGNSNFDIIYKDQRYRDDDENKILYFEQGDIIFTFKTIILESLRFNADFHQNLKLDENDMNYIDLTGILLLFLFKYIARNIENFQTLDKIESENKIKNISEIKNILLNLKDGIEFTNDAKKNIKAQLSEKNGNNILDYSNYINSLKITKKDIENLINKLFDSNKINNIKKFWSELSKYQTFNEDFERDFNKALEKSYFDFSLIGLSLYQQERRRTFVEKLRKCPNPIERFLFHGTRIDPLTNIVTEGFEYAKRPLFGMGVYFTDMLDYVSYYTGGTTLKNRRELFGKIISVGQTISCIATEVYYDKEKKENIYDNHLAIKELDHFPSYEEIKRDYKDKMVVENGVHFVRVNANNGSVKNKEKIIEDQRQGKFMGTEYVITEKDQFLPLYGLTLKRNEYFVVWRDGNFDGENRHSAFLNARKQFIYKQAKMNGFFDNNSERLLEIIKRKKYNKIILLSNCGVDLSGKKFVEIARQILGFDVMVLFFSANKNHLKWIQKFPNALYTNNSSFYEKYITNYNEQGLNKLKNEIETKYKIKLNFSDNILEFPKFVNNKEEEGKTIYKKYDDLIFEDICSCFRKVVIKSRENSKALFMNQNGTPELKFSKGKIETEKYVWYVTLMNNEITLFSNGSYLYFDMNSDTAKYKGMEIFNYEEINKKYFIYYKDKNNVLTIDGDNLIFTKENPNKKNQLFDFVNEYNKY